MVGISDRACFCIRGALEMTVLRTLNANHIRLRSTEHASRASQALLGGCAKGAEKASCGGTVVQKGVLESPFLLFPLKVFRCFQGRPYWGREETDSPKTPFWTTVSPHDAFSAPLAHSDLLERCERVLHFMGREVKGEKTIQNASCQMGGRELTGR